MTASELIAILIELDPDTPIEVETFEDGPGPALVGVARKGQPFRCIEEMETDLVRLTLGVPDDPYDIPDPSEES